MANLSDIKGWRKLGLLKPSKNAYINYVINQGF